MKKVVLAAVVLLLCASGCKHSHPGFTKVTGADDVSYFIKLDSITRTDTAIQFQLLREAKDGSYIVQSAATDCSTRFALESGDQFKKDGTKLGVDPASSVNLISEVPYPSVASSACRLASDAASFQGDFEVGKAMQVVYGNYDQKKTVSVWKQPSRVFDDHRFDSGAQVWAYPIWLEAGVENGIEKKFLVVCNSIGEDEYSEYGDRGTCLTLSYLGAFVFAHADGKWSLESGTKLIASLEGSQLNGNLPADLYARLYQDRPKPNDISLFHVGPNRLGINILSVAWGGNVDTTQSQTEMWFIPTGVTVSNALSLRSCDGESCYYTLHYSMFAGSNPEFYDVTVETKGKDLQPDERDGYRWISMNKTETLHMYENKYVTR
jgi:hypothetical protein